MIKKFDQKHAYQHGFSQADWDAVDAPELSDDELAKAKPFTEALPELAKNITRGRPASENPKVPVSIRLDQDVVEAFKKDGPGWQSRINDALRDAAHLR